MFQKSFKLYSSMEKIMIDKMPTCEELEKASILKNERFSFQIAYELMRGTNMRIYPVKFEIKSELKDYISVNYVEHIPSQMPLFPGSKDDSVISDKPGFYPDALRPLKENVIYPHRGLCDSLWFTVDTMGEVQAGNYEISVEFTYTQPSCTQGEPDTVYTAVKTIYLEIIDAFLPEQSLIFTQWFHCDCLASYYKVEAFSEKHWEIIENFMKVGVKNGHNVIFTPVFM